MECQIDGNRTFIVKKTINSEWRILFQMNQNIVSEERVTNFRESFAILIYGGKLLSSSEKQLYLNEIEIM